MPFVPIFALWFSNPLLLWGLGAASLPILIHLLNRRKYKEIPWAAMRFLMAAIKKNQRRVRIEQWLLLAVRTLLIALAVLAMAKPFLESLGAVALLPGQRTHWIIALDGSLSMDARENNESRLDQAKSIAAQLVKATRPGDGISLVLLASPPRAIIGAPAFQREAVLSELTQLTLTHGSLDLPASFRKIEEVLDASDIPRKEIAVLTDLQASSWNRPGTSSDENLKRLLDRLTARKARSTVIDLGKAGLENHAITDLKIDPPLLTPSTPGIVRATLRQFGRSPTPSLSARLIVDGRLGPEETIQLEPGQDQAVAFPYQFTDPGEHVVEIQLAPDGLALDDRRRLVVPVSKAVRVLLLDGDPQPQALKSETAFLAQAIDPEPSPTETESSAPAVSPLEVETIGESQLVARDLAPYDVIVLANVARFTTAEVVKLESYLAQGGGIVHFGGDRVVAENHNQLLYNDGKGLLPASIGPTVGDPARREFPFEFDALGFKHPIVALFAGESPGVTASLTSVKSARYHRLVLPKASTAQVALTFSSGDPAIIESPRSRGRVIQIATSADASWTTWPLHQSYPPIMEQIVLTAASGRLSERNLLVGQPLVQAFPGSAAGIDATIKPPVGEPVPARLQPDGEISILRFDATDLSGVYQADIAPPLDRQVAFAANTDPAESDPAKLDASALKSALPAWEFVYNDNLDPLSEDAGSIGARGEFHRPLLWGVLGLLLTESFLAWRFGHTTPRRFV